LVTLLNTKETMKVRTIATPKPKKERTASLSSPRKGSRMGCLCWNKPVYDIKCCDKKLGSQGIGLIQTSN
jgi:hypothetical protein